MDIKKIIIIIVALTITFLAGKYSSKPEVRIEKVEVVKEVIKEVKANNIETKIKETKKPDGTVIKETEIKDLTVVSKEENKESKKQDLTIQKNKSQWLIGGGMGYNATDRSQVYSIEVNTRILNLPAFIGVEVNGNSNNQNVLGKILVEF